ncbi:hypothetical protein CF319_g2697 [Tilletia indica]|nr:hypothetical protein CF319_g2697 [Tilletia indica]
MTTPSRYPVERSPFGPSGDAALSPRLLHLSSGGEALLPLPSAKSTAVSSGLVQRQESDRLGDEKWAWKSPTPNVEKLVKAWTVRDLTQWIRAVPPAELVAKLATSEEYINMDSFLERLSAATLDDKARITAKDR